MKMSKIEWVKCDVCGKDLRLASYNWGSGNYSLYRAHRCFANDPKGYDNCLKTHNGDEDTLPQSVRCGVMQLPRKSCTKLRGLTKAVLDASLTGRLYDLHKNKNGTISLSLHVCGELEVPPEDGCIKHAFTFDEVKEKMIEFHMDQARIWRRQNEYDFGMKNEVLKGSRVKLKKVC